MLPEVPPRLGKFIVSFLALAVLYILPPSQAVSWQTHPLPILTDLFVGVYGKEWGRFVAGLEIVVGRGLGDLLCALVLISMVWVALALAAKPDHSPQNLGAGHGRLGPSDDPRSQAAVATNFKSRLNPGRHSCNGTFCLFISLHLFIMKRAFPETSLLIPPRSAM